MRNEVAENNKMSVVSEEISFFRYAAVVEYLGTSYAGSQIQENANTVQAEIESVLKTLTGTKVKTFFSGRTDRGVHSKGQVIHFDLEKQVDVYRFIHSMNALLPSDISIAALSEVEKQFHAQKSAKYRWYRYRISTKRQRSVWSRESLHVNAELNVPAMQKALKYLEGQHDFSSFKSSNTDNPATQCIMYRAECNKDADYIVIDLVANRFLYNMVRTIIGTLLEIGKGNQPVEHMLNVLQEKDRTKAGPTASPNGLALMCVGYSKKYNIFDCINKEATKDENIFCKAS